MGSESGLKMRGISKYFAGVAALEDVDFTVNSSEVHALVGANGAGKSTLMKILSGAYQKSDGKVYLGDKELDISSPQEAMEHGIVTVYQEVDVAIVPSLSVAENIMMDHIAINQSSIFMNWKNIKTSAAESLKEVGIDIDLNQLAGELTLAEKQLMVIARAVNQKAKFLILDEPTASLSLEECTTLFTIVKRLSSQGVGVIFISHRLDEIFENCQRITVLKDGKLVGDYNIADETIDSIVEKMLGKKMQNAFPPLSTPQEGVLMTVEHLSGEGGIKDVSFNVNKGEIVGIGGLVGGGKTELLKLLFGVSEVSSGDIYLNDNRVVNTSPTAAIRNGFALVPEERRKEGVLVHETIETNITLPTLSNFCNGPFMVRSKINKSSRESVRRAAIKTSSERQYVNNLSGGNQQKVAIAKWLISDADIYLFDEPTKGVDVGSKYEIYSLIIELAKMGKGIVYASCEFDEILNLSNRTYIMYSGKISKPFITKNTNEEELLLYSTGGMK